MSKDLSCLQERLLQVFLRLCGYFPVGYLLHAGAGGTLDGEVDTLAVRFPWHREDETGNLPPPWLRVPGDKIDLLVCEAKIRRGTFNASLLDKANLLRIVRRFGAVQEERAEDISSQAAKLLIEGRNASAELVIPIDEANAQLRFIRFLGQGSRSIYADVQSTIHVEEVLRHTWNCLHPSGEPQTCSRNYALHHWAPNEDIVRSLKDRPKSPASLKQLLKLVRSQT